MKLIIDTNILIAENALRSNVGLAVRCLINIAKYDLVIPEVIKLEFEHNLQKIISEAIEKTKSNFNKLLGLFGELKSIELPEQDKVDSLVSSIFENSFSKLDFIPFTFESAKDSFMKTILGLAPSSETSQQFKDGVIWADSMKLLIDDDVILISSDKAFYENREYSKGIAKSLLNETIDKKHIIRIFPKLSDLLPELKNQMEFDNKSMIEFVYSALVKEMTSKIVEGILSKKEAIVQSRHNFASANPRKIYVEFIIEYFVDIENGETIVPSIILFDGNALMNSDDGEWSELNINTIEIRNTLTQDIKRHHYLYAAGGIFGHRTEYFNPKVEIE